MYPSVEAKFRAFNEPFEGVVPYMYLDLKGLVTVGVGNLIDPVELATALPFRMKHRTGVANPDAPATKDQIAGEWRKLKSDPTLAKRGYLACAPITELELDDSAINALIADRLRENETYLKKQEPFHAFDSWPADAQLALLSLAWAVGAGGVMTFHRLCADCQRSDFKAAALECKMNEIGNPGIVPRNRANSTLFTNAASVISAGASMHPSILYYPRVLASKR